MIIKIGLAGKSFKGLSEYLTHDPKANTNERVAWTHTHNLANDHVPSAVDEMVWTARNAELLKQEAGVRAGGRPTENSVKHASLNWAPDEKPTCEHMISSTEGFLRHMGWQEHQAVIVAHNDKHPHVHVMINVVHPETGLRLNDGFERRRAQTWALEYERQQGHIHCEQRLGNAEDREKAMPRNIWMAFQENEKEFQRTEKMRGENQEIRLKEPENPKNAEWKILKEFQRVERQEFFAQGKSEFSELRTSIYREVREEFRERWNDYYKAEKLGTEADRYIRDAVKVELVTDQKTVLETRRDAACLELRASRDARYREILDCQAEMRADLKWHQEVGLDSAPFFHELAERKDAGKEVTSGFRDAADEVTAPQRSEVDAREATPAEDDEPVGRPGRSVEHIVGRVGAAGVSFLDSLFFDLTTLGGGSTNPTSRSDAELFQAAADETQKRQQHELEDHDEDGRARQKVLYRE